MARQLFVALLLALATVVGPGCPSSEEADPHSGGNFDPPVDPEVQRIVDNLEEGSAEDQMKAIKEAAQLGAKARHAAESLCASAVSADEQVSRAAMVALQKVHPELYPHVRTIVTDENYSARQAAVVAIGEMGREGLGQIALAEPSKRAKIVAILKKHLDGFSKLYAVRALAFCGPEAKVAAEQVSEL